MDPLSVAASLVGLPASITGLLATSAQVAELFAESIPTHDYAQTVHDEIHDFRSAIIQLDIYINPRSPNIARAPTIDLDEVVIVLSRCALTFSELEREIKRLRSRPETLQRAWWTLAKSSLVDLVQRLQNHRATINLLLSILTSESQNEALSGMNQLHPATTVGSLGASIARSYTDDEIPRKSLSVRRELGNALRDSWVYRRVNKSRAATPRPTPATPIFFKKPPPTTSSISHSEVPNYDPLKPSIAEGPALLAIDFPESLIIAIKDDDMDTATGIANSVFWETVLETSAVYPMPLPDPSHSFEVLDHLALFKLWLECGGDLQAKNQRGQTAIEKALENEDWRLFKLLAHKGSDVNLTWDSKTVLHHVLGEGGEAFVLALCEDIKEEEVRAEIAPVGYDLERKRGQAVEVLLKLGADINATDGWEKTALHWFSEGGHKGLVKVLLSHGADIHAKDMWGTTSLHWASEGGHKAVVEVLLSHSADINAKDRWEMTSIYYASEGGHRGVVEVLLSHGADIGAENKWEKAALHCASWGGHKGVVEVLLSHGADIHAKDMWGTTSLHWASDGGNKGVVKVLLSHGAYINAKDMWGMTALHHASEGGHRGVVKILLGRGVDINAKERLGKSALDLASESGHKSVVEVLISHGADI